MANSGVAEATRLGGAEDAARETRKTVRSGNALLMPGSVTRPHTTIYFAQKTTGTRGSVHAAYSVGGGPREGEKRNVCLLSVDQPDPIDGQDLSHQVDRGRNDHRTPGISLCGFLACNISVYQHRSATFATSTHSQQTFVMCGKG